MFPKVGPARRHVLCWLLGQELLEQLSNSHQRLWREPDGHEAFPELRPEDFQPWIKPSSRGCIAARSWSSVSRLTVESPLAAIEQADNCDHGQKE